MNKPVAIVAVVALLFAAGTVGAIEPTRISVAKFSKDPKLTDALKTGFAAMRQGSGADPMSAAFHTSLAYWANTHGYFGTGKYANGMAELDFLRGLCARYNGDEICNNYYQHIISATPPADGYSDDIWGTCQHGTLLFLPWHRFYLHYFERTLRKQSREPSLALPYWNYYDNYVTKRKGLTVPPLLTPATSPLYDQWRTPGLNTRATAIDPDAADASQAFSSTIFSEFSNQLQNQPHGLMHCAMGSNCNTPDMGMVPVAGNDPVFYMHHANIDRLWQCWMKEKANGQPITLKWARENLGMDDDWFAVKFTFADENGKPVTHTVADVFSAEFMPQYDQLDHCDAKPPALLKAKAAGPRAFASTPLTPHAPLTSGKAVMLGDGDVAVNLTPVQGAPAPKSFAGQKASGSAWLVLENVQLQGAPALTYKIYLSSKSNPANRSYVATFNFFGVSHAHQGHAGHAAAGSLGTLVYKVNANLAELGIASAADIAVRFVPTDHTLGVKALKQSAGDGVTVANIRLENAVIKPEK
jgi:hypothetical protein